VTATSVAGAPRAYQAEAVEALTAALAGGGRAQLHAACGSGKTLIGVWTAERVVSGPGLIVVMVPTLALVAQTIATWRKATTVDRVLAVCSDDTVVDAPAHLGDVDAAVTTNADDIAEWITGSASRDLLVCTYISAPRLSQALTALPARADLVVFDEAHHLAGRPEFSTHRVLDDAYLPADRRLFMTATPRIDNALQESAGLLSMSDEDVFGPVAYTYPWAQAISDGHLEDYRLVVLGISETEMYAMLHDEAHSYVDDAGLDLHTFGVQTLLAKAARRYGLRRVLVFNDRLVTAADFARSLARTLDQLPDDARPEGQVTAEHISGEMNHARRDVVLDHLRHPPTDWTVVTNVRCLSEGVDVPAVDGVVFAHPKRSRVDIMQAVGRALRRSDTGTGTATILLPIVIPYSNESGDEVADLDPGDWRVLWQVVRALRAHDDVLGIELDRQRSHLPTENLGLPDKITIEMPASTPARLADQLKALLVKQTTSAWWVGFGHARDYARDHGHLLVSSGHVTGTGFALGRWILNARQARRKGWLSPDRVAALDEIGMAWNAHNRAWETFLDELRAFRALFGHAAVPQGYVAPSGYRLGSKVNTARTHFSRVPADIRATLDDLGMIWDARDLGWQQLYQACLTYRDAHGHLDVPSSHVTADGYGLGKGLQRRRKAWADGCLDPAERDSLAELGVTPWRDDSPWQQLLAACDAFHAEHGHLRVEKPYRTPDGYPLGEKISYYRNLHNGTKRRDGQAQPLLPERKAALDELGMIWRVAPARDITATEAADLAGLSGTDLAARIVDLIDNHRATQSSIAAALDIHRSQLNVKLRTYRRNGTWPHRGRYNATRPEQP